MAVSPRIRLRRTATRRLSSVVSLTLAGVLTATALTACSSENSDGSSDSTSATGGAYVTQSQKLLDEAKAAAVTGPSVGTVPADDIVPWKASDMPKPAAPPEKPLKVNVVYGIPVGYAPYAANVLKTVGAKLGWSVKIFQAASPTQSADLAAMQQALLDKPDAIVAIIVPAAWVAPALEKAKSQGVHTVLVHQDTTTGKGYDAYVPAAEGVQKALLGAWAVAKSDGNAHVVTVSAPGFTDVNPDAAKSYITACEGCKSEIQEFNPEFTDPTKVQSNVTAALSSRTGVDYLIWPSGGLPLSPVLNGISSSRNRDAQLLVDMASPENVQLLKDGKLEVVVHTPATALVFAALDDVVRLEQGQQVVAEDALRLPVSYWTKENAPAPDFASITTAQLDANDWLAPYEDAWGVQLKDTLLGVTK